MFSMSSSVKLNRDRTGSACAKVEHLGGRRPAAGQGQQLGGHPEQRVGLQQRTVCQPHPQLVGGMRAGDHLTEAKVSGDDQRGVGLDVGAHHQDVAGFQGRVVGEQAEQHLAPARRPGGAGP